MPFSIFHDVFDLESVDEWYQSIWYAETSVQEKIDGLTVALEYRNGILYQGATRGDGVTGEDVTENAKAVSGIPQKLDIPKKANVPAKNRLFVRAEVYMPVAAFERVNAEMQAAGRNFYANSRNSAAGSLRVKDPRIAAERGLAAISFAVLYSEGWENCNTSVLPKPGVSETGDLALLTALGFNAVYPCKTLDEIRTAIAKIGEHRNELSYWIDGAGVKTDDAVLQASIGSTAKYPKHAVAYKYPADKKETAILDIELQTGRTGVLIIWKYFHTSESLGTYNEWKALGINTRSLNFGKTGGVLSGLTFVITGTLPTMSREEAKALIE
ncbi:MAG: hypothetical protein K2O18_08740, partial [Oscillospiraceae bacterium]|nr:hypothetical protein [Oscillospiraceae bacterium]